jgi:hypothetical protein
LADQHFIAAFFGSRSSFVVTRNATDLWPGQARFDASR